MKGIVSTLPSLIAGFDQGKRSTVRIEVDREFGV